MIKIFDMECTKCHHTWDQVFEITDHPLTSPECPECGSNFTVRLPGGLKHYKAKDPYDYLDKPMPDTKKIFSGPKVHSK